MTSYLRDLTELTAVAPDDYILISDTSDPTNKDKRISKLNFSGGAMVGGFTLTMTSNGTLALGGFTLTLPATGVVAMQDVAQTLTNKTLTAPQLNTPVLSAPLTSGRARFNSGVAFEDVVQEAITLGDIASAQVLTIDLVASGLINNYVTDFALSMGRGGNANSWAVAYGKVSWSSSGTATIRDSLTSFRASGTVSGSVTGITNGLRITLTSSNFGLALNQNMFFHTTTGFQANNITVTPTIT